MSWWRKVLNWMAPRLQKHSDDDDEDEMAELMRELEKVKRERAEQKAKEV